ncbi:uncharacterized protein PODANS_3_2688 [Podospora anserina S mat+]|uniref:Podospora anserina S mat+ genomic DNA chromosome 3, supercontig 2 n=1 Tax=Podospora anserina (strain S / ATCC MYA-4624 / DSM 980 / FGSC 10383) TaxID=515849 RepID=B2AZR9_PODAN|nr:uncharacterized protein PODANS_3_2688 [Podospora anserina S mat+]CAP70169.1 unnamed protein product [Podospora anserina S mat+]CDP26762.1 Putative protein of unknown function [Podospora anserina S mat+]
MALNLLSLAPLLGYAFALPQSQPSASPNIQNLAMWGTGCPLGAAGLMSGVRNGTPIFSFSEWGLVLPNVDDPESETTASKFCTEEITLNNGPVGFQLRIETVTVGGWAELEEGTKLVVEAETKLGDVVAGGQTTRVTSGDLKGNDLEVSLDILPFVYSACVDESGTVPKIVIKTTVSLVGEKRADGTVSKGVVGGAKALGVHFSPVWRPCARPMAKTI